jgi:hypothetical protein
MFPRYNFKKSLYICLEKPSSFKKVDVHQQNFVLTKFVYYIYPSVQYFCNHLFTWPKWAIIHLGLRKLRRNNGYFLGNHLFTRPKWPIIHLGLRKLRRNVYFLGNHLFTRPKWAIHLGLRKLKRNGVLLGCWGSCNHVFTRPMGWTLRISQQFLMINEIGDVGGWVGGWMGSLCH